MKQQLRTIFGNTLFKNSFFLILATGVTAGFGFFFWLISSHLFSLTNIGLATTLISVMNMVAMLSLVGFDSAFIRYLPSSTNPNKKINTGFTIVTLASVMIASGFLIFVNKISPSLAFIHESIISSLLFVFFCTMTALNILTDSVFLARRKAKYTLVINTLFSACRMVLPLAFISWGAIGIFTAVGVSQAIGLALSIGVMLWKFDYRPSLTLSYAVLLRVKNYIFGNYIAGVLNLIPATILPIMITNHLGPEKAAFYYIIMMIGNLLYAIPWATTKSMFAEGSHEEDRLNEHTLKSSKIILILLTPAILFLYFWGDYVLLIFGKNYSLEGFTFLRIVALSSIAVSFYAIIGSYLKIKRDPNWLIVFNFFYSIGILGASYILLPFGLVGIGYGWIIGYLISSIVGMAIIYS